MPPSVLVVDDDVSLRTFLVDFLDLLGYDPEVAADGREAIDAVRRLCPDVVLIDMRLPDMTGADLLARIRMIDAAIPVIVISASEARLCARTMLERGAFDYVQKPFDVTDLERVIASAVGIAQHTVRAA